MKRSKFSLSNYKLLTCKMGQLVPVGLTEVLPGDTLQQSTSALIRCAPLVAPVMHPVHVRFHHWFVPFRILWNSWENFITGGPTGTDASAFPYITAPGGGFGVDSLADFLGVPHDVAGLEVSALPFRAYNEIFNQFYRDEDLVTALVNAKTDGFDTTTNIALQSVAWEKDYFTTSRPWTQKGPEVSLPLTGNAPVKGIGIQTGTGNSTTGANVVESGGTTFASGSYGWPANTTMWTKDKTNSSANAGTTGHYPNIYADLSGVTSASINDLRQAFALQRMEEARARFGSRYTEYLRYLGVKSSDARLQRPEYLGGGKQTIQFSEVLQTAPGSSGVVGDLFGHGIGAVKSNRYRRFFEEHGYVMTLMSVKPRTMYMQGLPKTFSRRTKEDFFQKELQHIGQQEVYTKEVYAGVADPTTVFGYQDRYDEYRRSESSVSGLFRTTEKVWHFAREFSSAPELNGTFVTSTPTTRPFANLTDDNLYCMVNHSIQARRIVAPKGNSFIS